jgi:hypothetical protein
MKINLHIERLILDGVASEGLDTARLSAAVRHELARLLVRTYPRHDVPRGGTFGSIRAGETLVSGTEPHSFGPQIAAAVYRSLSEVGPPITARHLVSRTSAIPAAGSNR